MNLIFPSSLVHSSGILLLRLTLAYLLIRPTYLISSSLTLDFGWGLGIVLGVGLLLFSIGSLFLIFGFMTCVTALALSIFLLIVHLGFQAIFGIPHIVLFLCLVLLGPGKYSIDYKVFRKRVPDGFVG